MRKIIYRFSFLLLGLVLFVACEENERPIFDTVNGRSIAGFSGATETPNIIYNPAADTDNVITVGVTTVSTTDRAVQLSLDLESSTLDPSFYTVSTLTPVIRAGEFTTDIIITTIGTPALPNADDIVSLSLVSVEGAEVLDTGDINLSIGVSVQCPEVRLADIPGTYNIIVDEFETSVGDLEMEVIAGPGPNQVTMVNPFDHPNPDSGGVADFQVVIDIDPDTGAASVARQPAWHCDNFGCGFGQGRVNGIGISLDCIGQIQLTLSHTVDAGSFGDFAFTIEKQ